MRRFFAVMLGLLAVTLMIGGGLARGGLAQTEDGGHAVVGSWRLTAPGAPGTPPEDPTLATFASDGTLILSGRAVRPALPGMPFQYMHFSAGHGVWEADDDGTVSFTVVHLRSDETGVSRGMVTLSGTLAIGDDGRTIAGDETFEVRDPSGAVQSVIPVPVTGERIEIEPMAGAGTPAA